MSRVLEAPSIIPSEKINIFGNIKVSEALGLARSLALIVFVNHGLRNSPQLTSTLDMTIHQDVLPELAIERITKHSNKLSKIGLTTKDHIAIFTEVFLGNMKNVKKIVKKSQSRLNNKKYIASKSIEDKSSRKMMHQLIVEKLLQEVPVASEIGKHQRIVMLTGPLASGKSETYKNMLQSKEFVMIDLDEIRKMLTKDYDASNQNDIQRFREESWLVSDLLLMEALKRGKSVLLQTSLHRRRWLKDKNILYARDNKIPIEIRMILRPMTDCINRNIDRDKRSAAMKDMLASMKGMAVLMKFVKKFANVSKVNLVDFWPLLERIQQYSPKLYKSQYQKLIEYAKLRSDIFIIDEQVIDLEILPE